MCVLSEIRLSKDNLRWHQGATRNAGVLISSGWNKFMPSDERFYELADRVNHRFIELRQV